ncbi:hypothetical protein AMTRI_Chr03g140390 [Amborella trichopoda]
MADFEYLHNMYDIRLRPRLLRSLMADRVPDEKRPLSSPLELSNVVSCIKLHKLLSETYPVKVDKSNFNDWKSAVDSWIERLLSLASSEMPDKCWAGVCLLGLTIQECSLDRFVASYSNWFQRLLVHLKPASGSHFIKVTACASLLDLFTRLGGIPNVKKEGTSLAGKLIQPILQLLSEDCSETVCEGVVDLLCTLITFFPSSIHHHYDNVEAAIASKIISGTCSTSVSKKFARGLAFLPKARSDADSWFSMMQKIIISINSNLNQAFEGLEGATKGTEVTAILVPPGKDPPPPLGGQSVLALNETTKRFWQLLTPRVSVLMQCCSMMLTNAYPVQVTVPIRPLLALVGRVMSVDGALCQTLMPILLVSQQLFLCSELPLLQLCSLDLLTSIIKGVGSQLLPHAADVVRLLTECFRRCALPDLRIKLYSIAQTLLISMGIGMALYLASEVLTNAFVDLKFTNHNSVISSSELLNSKKQRAVGPPSNQCKRKRGSEPQPLSAVDAEAEDQNINSTIPVSVQISALKALEALLTVQGGTLRSECWRTQVDLLLITTASNAFDGFITFGEANALIADEPASIRADFQLAAFEALLASLLSPCGHRPPYLSQGLALFREGKREGGTRLAEFCAHALLALEPLIHPRALPLSSVAATNMGRKLDETTFSSGQKPGMPFLDERAGPSSSKSDDFYDALCSSWLKNSEEPESKDMNQAEEPGVTGVFGQGAAENVSGNREKGFEPGVFDKEMEKDKREGEFRTGIFDKEMENVGDRREKVFGTCNFEQEMMESEAEKGEKVFETSVFDKDVMENVEDKTEEVFGGDALDGNVVSRTGEPFSSKGFMVALSDSEPEPLPDIVDSDPDTD